MSAFPPTDEPQLALRVLMMPRDTNHQGTIFGGIILSMIDQAAGVVAARRARGGCGVHQRLARGQEPQAFHQRGRGGQRQLAAVQGAEHLAQRVQHLQEDIHHRRVQGRAAVAQAVEHVLGLVRDGDHRLSRPEDISRLLAFVDELCG